LNNDNDLAASGSRERRFVAPASDSLVRSILGCKWTLTVFELLRDDIRRPGAMVREVSELSTKSLNECLRRLGDFGLVKRTAFAEVPPRVEYELTERGSAVAEIFDAVVALDERYRGA